MCNEYNGWTNYETWLVNLHLSNDESTYDMLREEIETRKFDDSSSDVYAFSQWLKSYCEDYLEELGIELPMMYSDLLNGALSSANWYSIAEHWISDYLADNPIKTTGKYSIEYTSYDRHGHLFLDGDDYYDSGYNFWEVFELAIQDAIDNNYTSVEIVWKLDPDDLDDDYRLILDQHKRNTRVIK